MKMDDGEERAILRQLLCQGVWLLSAQVGADPASQIRVRE